MEEQKKYTIKQGITEFLTPKDTEELRPNLFIQKKGEEFRQIHPAAWNGKINYKNLFFGGSPLKGIIWVALILFMVFGYKSDVGAYQQFYETVMNDPQTFCASIPTSNVNLNQVLNQSTYNLSHNSFKVEVNKLSG